MKIITSDIAKITMGVLQGLPDLAVTGLLTDSRQFSYSEGLAFFAIKGQNHNGHDFIFRLYDRGIRIFIVEALPFSLQNYKESSFVVVGDTIKALQAVAAFKRKQFKGTVIAVTGSAGKTVVKEWLADLMGSGMPVIRSPKSYNSQIGVPLSIWKLDEQFTTGIFEAGISRPGEMKKLRTIIDPDIGIITNIGDAHGENFPDLRTKAAEKLVLFENCSAIIYNCDYGIIRDLIRNDTKLSARKIIDWSFHDDKAEFLVTRSEAAAGKTLLRIRNKGKDSEFVIPFTDRASVENAVNVAVTCIFTGMQDDVIRKGLASLVPVAMRMEIKNGINGCMLIEDFYNSDPGSLGMALEYLVSQNNVKRTLILSDFIQSGRDEGELYSEVASLVKRTGIAKFIGIGETLQRNSAFFDEGSRFYHSTDDFILHYPFSDFRDEIILLKGARFFEFERIGQHIEQQVHQTVLEINLDAISHNLNIFRQHISQGTRIMAMVKAFAYGAGPSEIAGLLEYHRIDYLAVAYADEGVGLRQAGVSLPIVVMNPEASAFGVMIKYDLEPEIYSLSLLRQFADAASRHGLVQYPVHIKIDTGMHRLGFLPGETVRLISDIRNSACLKIVSVFSHLAASEDPSLDDFTRKQVKVFLSVTERIREATGSQFLRHILNSAGIIRFPEYQFEMVRLGIGLYGVNTAEGLDLRPAGRYLTRISQIKVVPRGEPVGYGCADVSDNDRLIAILPVGYADGLDRKLGNRNGKLFIAGVAVPIIGNVCMDMCMADITGLDAKEGDVAEIFGENISVEEMARNCDTIAYEVLTSIPARVKRIFCRE
ncbi:MAG: bifunctional UDP-N-acetylmuramoyl-tripeptide:D-alanyl-D-alanine ligase/alanine racemase [Bacteroidales bacterium]